MASDALISALMKDVAEGLEVLRARDGVELTDAQIEERCRNIVTGLVNNYFVSALSPEEENRGVRIEFTPARQAGTFKGPFHS